MFSGSLVLQTKGRYRSHHHPILRDDKRVLVRVVLRAPVFGDTDAPGGYLLDYPVVEHYDAVGYVLLKAITGDLVMAPLAGDHGRHALRLQPAEEPPKLGAHYGLVGQTGEERLN